MKTLNFESEDFKMEELLAELERKTFFLLLKPRS